MNSTAVLDDADWHRFSEAVDASFEVANRQQFFVWTQSAVQGLVPHQILLCGVRDPARQTMLMQHFSASRYFRDEQFVVVSDPRQGLAPRLFAAVEEAGQSVVFVAHDTDGHRHAPLMALVEANELQNLAAVQLAGIDGQAIALFGFARVPAAFDARLRRQIELLVPHLYSTFLRVLTNEREVSAPSEGKSGRVITPRQAEILSLIKDGKTNAQIAELLDCSQWTIKNHIQNILRRLETNSRAHALVQAMRLGILSPD